MCLRKLLSGEFLCSIFSTSFLSSFSFLKILMFIFQIIQSFFIMSSIFVRCLLLEMSLFIFMERVVRIQTFKKGMMFTQLMVLYSHPSS